MERGGTNWYDVNLRGGECGMGGTGDVEGYAGEDPSG